MTTLPTPCIVPGCGRVTRVGSRCDRHGRDGFVGLRGQPGYGSAWRRVRATVLERDGYRCQVCGRPATDVDHIVRRRAGGTDDSANLRSLCSSCHHTRTSSDGGQATAKRRRRA
jgi:5-methylcytosine-specific restriction enzyme A